MPNITSPTTRQTTKQHIRAAQPLGIDHLTLTGRYCIALLDALRDRGAYPELNTAPAVAA